MLFEVIRGHLTPKLGGFGVIWGQNSKIFKPRQIIHQNEALDLVIKKNLRSSDFELASFKLKNSKIFKLRLRTRVIEGHFGV